VEQQYQVEIPRKPIYRRFHVGIGCCSRCGKRVQGRHPLQTSDALGAAASQLGPDLQSALVELNKYAGLSHGKVVGVLKRLFGIDLSRGGSAKATVRVARRLEPTYDKLCQVVRRAAQVVPDETGWRIAGRKAWLHTFVCRLATVYVIAADRSQEPAASVLGPAWRGTMVHDGWAPYDGFAQADHQQCLAHLLRRCGQMLEVARGAAVRFPRRVAKLLTQALELRDRRDARQLSLHGLRVARGRLASDLWDAICPPKTDKANERLAQHLWNHFDELLTFLYIPGTDATNYRAEHALRFAVVNRKVWGGNRTDVGAHAQEITMSVWRTCWQHGLSAVDCVSHLLRRRKVVPLALPP
jgi:transposase